MSFHVEIDLADLAVLIVGGGNVALRKCKQCLEEGAQVSVLSKTYVDGFATLAIHRITGSYHRALLDAYALIIVATNDADFQKRVLEDAQKKHRLAMGVHTHERARLHPMVSAEYEYFQIALSTKGGYPAITKRLVQEAGDYIQEREHDRLALLAQLRKEIMRQCTSSMRHEVCHQLVDGSIQLLRDTLGMLQHDVVHLFCFHGVKDGHAIKDVVSFCKAYAIRVPKSYVGATYLSKPVCDAVNKDGKKQWHIDEIMHILQACQKKQVILHPMLFQDGCYYAQMKAYQTSKQVEVAPLPFPNIAAMQALLTRIEKSHPEFDTILVRYHSLRSATFYEIAKKLQPTQGRIVLSFEKTPPQQIPIKGKRLLIYPLYMLKGLHMQQDEVNLTTYFEHAGYYVECSMHSVIRNEELRTYLLDAVVGTRNNCNSIPK